MRDGVESSLSIKAAEENGGVTGDTGRADVLYQGYGSAGTTVGDEALLGGIHGMHGTFFKGVQLQKF